jgi:hypothetical protein
MAGYLKGYGVSPLLSFSYWSLPKKKGVKHVAHATTTPMNITSITKKGIKFCLNLFAM